MKGSGAATRGGAGRGIGISYWFFRGVWEMGAGGAVAGAIGGRRLSLGFADLLCGYESGDGEFEHCWVQRFGRCIECDVGQRSRNPHT